MSLTLTQKEIRELTGKKYFSAQRRVLCEMQINYKSRPDGSPAVDRVHYESVMNGQAQQNKENVSLDFSQYAA